MPPAPSTPLPEDWAEGRDSRGRLFFINHRTRTTTWERPVAPESPSRVDEPPPPYTSSTPEPQNTTTTVMHWTWTPSAIFWGGGLLACPVWLLAMVAFMDDHWFEDVDYFFVGSDLLSDGCDDNELTDAFCKLYSMFSIVQVAAVFVSTISLCLFLASLCRPATGKCWSARSLGTASGAFMVVYASAQMLAFVAVVTIKETEKDFGGSTEPIDDPQLGPTFGAAVAAVLLAILQAGSVIMFAHESGDGPFRIGVNSRTGLNTHSVPVSGPSAPHPPRPASRPPVLSPTSELVLETLAAQWAVTTPTVQPAVASPAVQPPVTSPAVRSTVVYPTIGPPVARTSVDSRQ